MGGFVRRQGGQGRFRGSLSSGSAVERLTGTVGESVRGIEHRAGVDVARG
jgi:hypothetical protein